MRRKNVPVPAPTPLPCPPAPKTPGVSAVKRVRACSCRPCLALRLQPRQLETMPQALLGTVAAWPDCAGAPHSGRSGPRHLPKKLVVEGFSNLWLKSGAPRTWLQLRRPLSPLSLTCSPMSCLTHVVMRSTAAAHATGNTLGIARSSFGIARSTGALAKGAHSNETAKGEITTDSHPSYWAPPCCQRAPMGGTPAGHRPCMEPTGPIVERDSGARSPDLRLRGSSGALDIAVW